MSAPSVLIDVSMLQALVDPADGRHVHARRVYAALVDRYERNEIRLRARVDHVRSLDASWRRTLLAPIESISVAAQYRRAATRLRVPAPLDDDVAITLVVMRRERIRSIATYHQAFEAFDMELVADQADRHAAGSGAGGGI